MNKRVAVRFITLTTVFLSLAACTSEPVPVIPEPVAGLANPASVHCDLQGGRLEIRNNAYGQYGVCIFADGSECEEWQFFNGDCEAGQYQQAEDGLMEVNLTEIYRLSEAISLDIYELNSSATGAGYTALISVDDETVLSDITTALNTEIHPGPPFTGLPNFQLHFMLADGSQQTFGFNLLEGQPSFLDGSQPDLAGADWTPPAGFADMLLETISAAWPQTINVAQSLDLYSAIYLEVQETIVDMAEAEQTIVSSHNEVRLLSDDPEAFAALIAAIDHTADFKRNIRCPSRYHLLFSWENGEQVTLGYLCAGSQEEGVLRSGISDWHGQAVETTAEFEQAMMALLAAHGS